MIAPPLNDEECLGQFTAITVDGLKRTDVQAVAARFRSTRALVGWIRSLPQRDDDGDPKDGPRVACDVGQRARLVADDPNCVVMSSCRLWRA